MEDEKRKSPRGEARRYEMNTLYCRLLRQSVNVLIRVNIMFQQGIIEDILISLIDLLLIRVLV